MRHNVPPDFFFSFYGLFRMMITMRTIMPGMVVASKNNEIGKTDKIIGSSNSGQTKRWCLRRE